MFELLRAPSFRTFRFYLIGQAISVGGTWMHLTAINWLVFAKTDSVLMLGILNLLSGIVAIPLALIGGIVADRYSKKLTLVFLQLGMCILAFSMFFLLSQNSLTIWLLLVLEIGIVALRALDVPAREAYIFEIVEPSYLTVAIGLERAVFNLGRIVGPLVAGLLIASQGINFVFLADSISFVAVFCALLPMASKFPSEKPEEGTAKSQVINGFRYAIFDDVIRSLLVLIAISAFLAMPFLILLPVFASDVLLNSSDYIVGILCQGNYLGGCNSPEALIYSLLLSAVGIGSMIGAVTIGLFDFINSRRLLLTCSFAFPILLLIFSFSISIYLSLFLLILVSISRVQQHILVSMLLKKLSLAEMRGRVMSLYTIVGQGALRGGGVFAGFMAETIGASKTIAVSSAMAILVTFGLLVILQQPKLAKLNDNINATAPQKA